MRILFGLNQSSDNSIEENILKRYREKTNKTFEYKKEFDLIGIGKQVAFGEYDILILNELLERQNAITTDFLDRLTDKYSNLRIIFIVDVEGHDQDNYIKKLFNIGIYDVVYSYDLSIDILLDLIIKPRLKAEAKAYLNISEIEDVVVESELEYIPEDELNNILDYFSVIEKEMIPQIFEHVCSQYNEKQIMFLIRVLPDNVIDSLKKNDNEIFKKYYNRIPLDNGVNIEEKIAPFKKIKVKEGIKREDNKDVETKIITKNIIQKEYIIPDDYKKVVLFLGNEKTGVTTIVDLISGYFSDIGKKVVALDMTSDNNGIFKIKSWGREDIKVEQNVEKILINSNYEIGKIEANVSFLDVFDTITLSNDLIIVDGDFNISPEILKWANSIFVVSDLNVLNCVNLKNNLKNILKHNVNAKKQHLIINKYVKCKVSEKDIVNMLKQPIPYLEGDEPDNYININERYFTIDFDIELYKRLLSSYIYVDSEIKINNTIKQQLDELASYIYPINQKEGILQKIKTWRLKHIER